MSLEKTVESRQSPRRAAGWRAIIKSSVAQEFLPARTINVSAQGIMIEAGKQLPVNSVVLIKLEVIYKGEKDEFIVTAKVRHNVIRKTTFLIGMQITTMEKDVEDFLYDYSHDHI